MHFGSVTNLRWANEARTAIDCTIETEEFGPIPFTASANDAEAHSKVIFERAINGDFGPISAFIRPPPIDPEPTVPDAVTPRQLKLALLATGKLDAVEAFVATEPREVQVSWQNATEFRRDNELLIAMARKFGMSDAELANTFRAAARIR